MPTPTDKKLYEKVKARIKRRLASKGQRWSARASQQLVNEYKKAGGGYRGQKSKGKLTAWQKENWVAINSTGKIIGPCGSSRTKGGKQYRCLPKAKANSLSKSQRASTAKKKLKSPSKVTANTKKARYVRKKR